MHLARPLAVLCGILIYGICSIAAEPTSPSLTTIHRFTGSPDGSEVSAGSSLIISAGSLFATTSYGGAFGYGTIFSLAPPASGQQAWIETIVYSFQGASMGWSPGEIAVGNGGVIYGLAAQGPDYYGFIFSLSPPSSAGGAWVLADIYDFDTKVNEGGPGGPLALDSDGVIYGTTQGAGANHLGTVYSLTPPGNKGGSWKFETLHTFTGEDGSRPAAGVIVGSGGVLYGTTGYSYNGNDGVVFSLAPPSSQGAGWTYSILAYLSSSANGTTIAENPAGGLVLGEGGVLYGTTFNANDAPGTVFSLTPPAAPGGAWTYSQLYEFTYGELGSHDGAEPQSPLVLASSGVLYGVTPYGGLYDQGTVFVLAPPSSPGGPWRETVLYSVSVRAKHLPTRRSQC